MRTSSPAKRVPLALYVNELVPVSAVCKDYEYTVRALSFEMGPTMILLVKVALALPSLVKPPLLTYLGTSSPT